MKPTWKKDRPESVVLKECLEAVCAAFWPGTAWRQNAGKIQTSTGHWVELGPEGIADIVGVVPTPHGARIFFVECKRRRGKQREAQKRFQAAMEAIGVIYVVAETGAQAVDGVTKGLRTPAPASLPHGASFPGLG